MSYDKIQQLVGSLAKSVEDNQKIAIPVLAAKLNKFFEAYPHDQTIGSMVRVVDQMALNNNLFIRRAEFKDLYRRLYSRNSKFAELFKDELGVVETESPTTTVPRDDSSNIKSYEVADPILANALNSVFDKNLPVKMYSQALATTALKSVASALDAWNLKPSSIDVKDGNDKFLVICADYETPKGITSLYVPIEIHNNTITEASVFMANAGPQELNNTNIKSYLTSHAGDKLKVNASGILHALTAAVSENREISDAELALTRLNATRQGKSEFFQGQIVGQKIAEASVQDVSLPKYDEFESFEKTFTIPSGEARWRFGDNVAHGMNHITRELKSFGFKNAQVVVSGSDENTIFYGVSLDAGKVAFTIPIKISKNQINKPSYLLCNGSLASFDFEGINKLYTDNQTDYKVASVASPLYGLKPSEIINTIRQAMTESNYAKAEDALNVLSNSNDEKAYATGLQVYLHGLTNKKEAQTTCSMIVKNATSEHPICGHTGLPVHKVFQDKYGNCQPLYRKGMAETYEGASFINAKIFG